MTLWKWSRTADDNDDADSTINWAEGQAPSSVNNSARALMAAAAKYRDDISGNIATGGSSTAYTITTNQGLTALTDGFMVAARLHTTSGATPTLAVDGLTAKQIRSVYGTNIPTGALLSGSVWAFVYDSTDDAWIVHGVSPAAIPLTNIAVTGGTALTAPATDDELPIYDLSATANKKITLADALKVVGSLTADSSPDPAADYALTYDNSATAAKRVLLSKFGSFGTALVHVRDEKSSGTAAASITSGGWRTRLLNTTKTNEVSGASLNTSTGVLTLPAGTYFAEGFCPRYVGNNAASAHQARLYNATAAAELIAGRNSYGAVSATDSNMAGAGEASVTGRFTLSVQSDIQLEHRVTTTSSGGIAHSWGTEVYAELLVWKVA